MAATMEESATTLPTLVLVGATGSGKSSTGNSLLGSIPGEPPPFHVEDLSMASVTAETKIQVGTWRSSSSSSSSSKKNNHGDDDGTVERQVRCVDSPGLGDSEGRDGQHIAGLATALKDDVRYVNTFLIVFNSQEPRLNIHLREMLVIFKTMFGADFLRHVAIAFTRFEFDKRAKKRRQRSGVTGEHLAKAINEELRKALGHDFDCPVIFLDNELLRTSIEDLEDEYDEDELEVMLDESRAELEKLFQIMVSKPAFCCKDVKAVATEKERLKKKIMQLIDMVDEKALGRQIISAEQGVMHRGWIRWRRRWIWGVLRRQHLRFFESDTNDTPTGPREVDLTGCICSSGSEWESVRRYPTFTVYRPVNKQSADSSYFCHIFQVPTEVDRQRWVVFVQEATQVCESCHRIEKFHLTLQTAPTREEYERAISLVEQETMVVPVEWVLQTVHNKHRKPTLQQALKDLSRDNVEIDGMLFATPGGSDSSLTADDLAAHLCARVLLGVDHLEDDQAEIKAAVMARDVLIACSRTQGGGDTLDAVNMFFGNENDLVFCRPDPVVSPILVRVMRRSNGGTEGDALRSMGPDTGVPAFQRDESAAKLSADLWRRMDHDSKQMISACMVGAESWVPDWQMVQCMRCGERFNPLLRRHHCRACGALVCYSCSRHFVALTPEEEHHGHLLQHHCSPSPAITAAANSTASSTTAAAGAGTPQPMQQRVCFLCYQKAVIKDLNARKERGLKPVLNDDDDLSEMSGEGTTHPTTTTTAASGSPKPGAGGETEMVGMDLEKSSETTSFTEPEGTTSPEGEAPEDADPWPTISVEMRSRYKIMSTDIDISIDEWFVLECRYVKLVRWSGLADEGRIFISVQPALPEKAQSPKRR